MDISLVPANDLAGLCSDAGSTEAWHEFVRRFQRPIALAVLRTARLWGSSSPNLVDDLVQDTFLSLCAHDCRRLREFVSREPDSIAGYLKVIAANVTHDHFRAEKSQKRGGLMRRYEAEDNDLTFLPSRAHPNPAVRALEMQELDCALQALIPSALSERDRTIFWLYFHEGFTARDIASIDSVRLTIKGVESSIHRTTLQLRQVMQRPRPAPPKGFPSDPTIKETNG